MNSPRPSYDARKSLDSRQSLDAKPPHPPTNTATPHNPNPRSALKPHPNNPPTDEDNDDPARFEDVGLNDDPAKAPPPGHKKKGIFARFGDSAAEGGAVVAAGDAAARPSSAHRGFHLPGRKRGQSGQGSELGNIENIGGKGEDDGVVR